MAVNAGSVYAELILDASKYEENLKKAENQMKTFTDKLGKIGKGMKKAGDTLSKYITAPVIGAGAAATKLGMDFEAQMSRVQAISGATGAELEKLNEVALQLGADTAFSALEVAMAMENLASAGFTTNEIISALPGNLDLAAASGADLATATDIAASILRGFQLDAAEAGRVADVLAEAANRTNAGVEDMGEAMKYIAPVANAMGLSLEETAAAVGILADAGIKGSQAGTTLRGALTRLTKPTKQMQKEMNQLGLEFFDAQGNMKPLAEIIAELEEGTKGLTQEQKNQALATLFGQEALSGMLVLTEEGPDALEELTKGFENSSGAAKEAADIMMNNTKGAIEEMMGALETAGIKIFQAVAPTITDLATKVGELADKFSALPEETQKNIIKFAALAAAIGPLLILGRKMATGIGSIIGLGAKLAPVIGGLNLKFLAIAGPIAAAIAAGVLLYKNWDTIKEKAGELGKAISEKWESIKTKTKEAWGNVKETISEKWEGIKSKTKESTENVKSKVNDSWNNLKSRTSEAWGNMKATVERNGGGIKGVVRTMSNVSKSVWSSATSAMDRVTGGKFSSMASKVSGSFSKIKRYIQGGIDKIGSWNSKSVKEKFSSIATKIGNSFSKIKSSIQSGIDKITVWNNTTIKDKVATFTQKVRTVGDKIISGLGIGRNARGTNYWRGGLTWVGEQGPELIGLPRGSKVYSHEKSKEMVKGINGGITQNITINSPEPLSPSEIARKNLQVSRQLAMEWGV